MLKTVRVPAEMEPVFAVAEEAVSRFFRSRTDDPEHGTIEIFGERYILVRAASLSVEFFELLEQLFGAGREVEADQFARNILFDLAHALGRSDARNFHRKMNLVDPIAKLSAGPVHFSHAGWAFVDIFPNESRPLPNDDYYLIFDHPYSFESDAWLRAGKTRQFAVCIMNAGWSSGWCEESFGVQLVSSEVMCRAKGDNTCRFIMAPPQRIERYVEAYLTTHIKPGKISDHYEIPDFFARKRAEEELQRVYERLKKLDKLKTQFFANVSHELRTPLMLIAGPVETLLGDTGLTTDQRSWLEVIQRNARVLHHHVDDLLDVAKLEAGKMEVRYTETDLAELVRMVTADFEALARERRIAYRIETDQSMRAVLDTEKIERVVVNLLSNAFTFTPAGGSIRAELRLQEGNARLEIADSGPGVSPDLRDVVFERFRQGEGGVARTFGGTGLGLAIARDFVKLHGGTIAIGDAPEGGALVSVALPVSAPVGVVIHEVMIDERELWKPTPLVGSRATEMLAVEPPDPAAPCVLVVEDNPDMMRFVAAALGRNYRVETAADGQEGLEKACALNPDLIVTDIMMPRLSGDALVREVRSRAELNATPILVLTARNDDELRVQLLGEGAQDYLAKPFSEDELLARAKNLVTVKRTHDLLQADVASKSDHLEELAREIVHRNRELQAAVQAKTTFLGLVSHELTTPLQSMRLNLDALERGSTKFSPTQNERIGRVVRASNRLTELIEALLEFVRLESGRLEVHRADVSLRDVAAQVLDDLSAQARQKGLEISLTASDDLPLSHTDARLVRVILVNLVGNAVKYSERGKIEVRIDHDEGSHTLRVMDTGRGIPPDKQAAIFEPFTQLEALKQKHLPGVGLGLTLARDLVRALGGDITVASRAGHGSTFSVTLPKG